MPPDGHLLSLGQYELVAAYVAVATLLLSIVIWNRVRWWIRAVAVVVTAAFFFVSFDSVRNILGWPTSGNCPTVSKSSTRASRSPTRPCGWKARSTSGR